VVLLAVTAVALAEAWWTGPVAVIGVVLGFTAGVAPAILSAGWTVRGAAAIVAVASGIVALLTAGHPWWSAAVVASTAMAQAPLNLRANGIGLALPGVPAVTSSLPLADRPWTLGFGLCAGLATALGVAALLRVQVPVRPVPAGIAWRHAAVLAVACGGVTAYLLSREVSHGYWIVLTISAALRPAAGETIPASVDRVVGAVLGGTLALVLVTVAPAAVSVLLAVGCALLMIGWAVTGDTRRQNVFLVPVIVLFSSSGAAADGAHLAAQRMILTLVGATAAMGLALAVHWADARASTAQADDQSR
jgi:hypothetical protein